LMAEYISLEQYTWAWIIGGFFAGLAIVISFLTLYLQYKYNGKPRLRIYIFIILTMIPIYASTAWLDLFQKQYTMFWDIFREICEALVIYSFYRFLVVALGGSEKLMTLLNEKHDIPHIIPFKMICSRWGMKEGMFYIWTRRGILQFVPVKIVLAAATFILQYLDYYKDGEFDYRYGYIYQIFVGNISQILAMYCLALLYQATKTELLHIRSMTKLLCIITVIFITFWQGILIAFLVKLGTLNATLIYTTESPAKTFQDFIICFEMFLASLAYYYAFPYKEFYTPDPYSITVSI